MDIVPVTLAGSADAASATAGGSPGGILLAPRVIIAPGPRVDTALIRHREFYVKPRHSLLPPDGVVPHRRELGALSYRAQLGFLLQPTDRHTPAPDILRSVRGLVAVAEVVSVDRLEVGWEGTMWHIRYGEGGAFDGSCPVGPSLARIDRDTVEEALGAIGLTDSWGTSEIDPGAAAEFLEYVNQWIRLGPDVLVLAGARHGPRLELDGRQPRVVFDDVEPRVLPGGRIKVDAGVLGRIDVAVDRVED